MIYMFDEIDVIKPNALVICGIELITGDINTKIAVNIIALAGTPFDEISRKLIINFESDSSANW